MGRPLLHGENVYLCMVCGKIRPVRYEVDGHPITVPDYPGCNGLPVGICKGCAPYDGPSD